MNIQIGDYVEVKTRKVYAFGEIKSISGGRLMVSPREGIYYPCDIEEVIKCHD